MVLDFSRTDSEDKVPIKASILFVEENILH
mgnify:CR=1 FL=1